MESKIEDGGPAFPPGYEMDPNDPTKVVYRGLTKRDWFAGQALTEFANLTSLKHSEVTAKVIANLSYQLADAMLAARKAGA